MPDASGLACKTDFVKNHFNPAPWKKAIDVPHHCSDGRNRNISISLDISIL